MSQTDNTSIEDTRIFQCRFCKKMSMRKNGEMFKCDNCGKALTLQEGFEEIKSTIEEIQKMDKYGIKKKL